MILSFIGAPRPWERPSTFYLLITCPLKFILRGLYDFFTALRVSAPVRQPAVRVVCISDTHTLKPDAVPNGDVLIHAGDLTNKGTVPEIQEQIDWISSLPHPHKICIAGNHDTYLDARSRQSLTENDCRGGLDWKGVNYLQHSTVDINIKHPSDTRRLRVYGAPQIPACGPMDVFAFQYGPSNDAWTETVPSDIDILVTHTPPKHHMDISLPNGYGCPFLLKEVRRVRPTLHIFGHVHWGAGQEICYWDKAQAAYERGLDRSNGWTVGILDVGLWIDILRVIVHSTSAIIWERVWGGEDARRATRMVNAAQMWGNTGTLGSQVQVVDI